MRTFRPLSVMILLIHTTCLLHAQEWKDDLREFLLQGKSHIDFPGNPADGGNSREIMEFIAGFANDSLYEVRVRALEAAHHIATTSEDIVTRQTCIHMLLQPVADRDLEITGTALAFLKTFGREDFTTQAKDTIRILIKNLTPDVNELIRIAGFLKLDDLEVTLRGYTLPGNAPSTRWAALLALARMGHMDMVLEVLKRVERLAITDEVVYSIFPDLTYTRQPRVIAYLTRLIYSDEKGCLSADAEREMQVPCAYRIIEQLAPIIEGFPLEADETGDLITRDYPAALALVRNWFQGNNTLTIRNDKY